MRHRWIALEWVSQLSLLIAAMGMAFVLLSLALSLAVPSVGIRVTIVAILGSLAFALIFWAVAKSTIRAPEYASLALVVERRNPELKNRLIAALQLADHARANPEGYSLDLIDLTIRQAMEMSQQIDFAAALDRARVRRSARLAGIGLGATLLLAILFPGLASRSWEAYSNPLTDYSAPIPYDLSVEPGSVEAVKFDDFKITARVMGTDLPAAATIHQRTVGGDWREIGPVAALAGAKDAGTSGGVGQLEFRHTIPQIKHDFEYFVTAGERTSSTYTVTAVDRPLVTGLRLEIFPPAYTGIAPSVVDENDGTISAPVGTTVKMRLESNRPLSTATVVYSDGETRPLEVRSQSASAELTIDKNRSYHLALLDASGRTNPHPIDYSITAIADRQPSVEIVMPGHNLDLTDAMAVDLKIVARDDYGFSRMVLHTRWLSEGRERAVRDFDIPGAGVSGERLELGYFWDLANWGLMPEDVVHYYVEITDNDRVTGPKSAQSRTFSVRLPSLDEQIAEFEQARESDLNALDRILEGEREMSRKLEELRRDIATQKEIDWNKQKGLEELSSKGQKLNKELDEVAQRMQEQVQQAQQQKLQSVELIQKMIEAQQLFNEVATDEMREAMRKLQEAMQQLDPKEVQSALSQMNLSQEELLKRLERTVAYLKKLQAEQKIDAFVKRLEEMLAQQEALNKEAGESPREKLPDLAPSEERLKSNFDKLAEDLMAAESMLAANQIAPPQKIQGFCQSAQKSPAPGQMKETAQNMSEQNKGGAQKSGGQCAGSLKSLLDEMKSFQKEMSSAQQAEMARKLREALDKVFYVSDQQEDLMARTGQVDPMSLSLRDMAAEQEALRSATERLGEQLSELGKKSTCLSNQLGENIAGSAARMRSSAEALSERQGPGAQSSQRESLFDLNQAAQQLVDGMEKNSGQCQKPGSGSCDKPGGQGAMGKMQTLSQQQGRLNEQMPGHDLGGGSTMSPEERKQLARLRAEQQAIQQGVSDLNKELGDRRDLPGRLDKLGEEMQRVLEDMDRSKVTDETRERQRRIYTRMLDFQHSLQKQDYKEERKAQFGENMPRSSPGALDPARGLTDEEYERLLTRYQEEGYPKEYEETIKAYFRALVEARGK
jgi:DNA-binding transcriptional regulator YiaG